MSNASKLLFIPILALVLSACSTRELNTKVSHATGWNYFDEKTTNFQAYADIDAGIPTGMVAIEGGTFTIGERDEFITAPRNNFTRTLTVSSFYMDKYEITNMDWNEYLHWMDVVFNQVAPELITKALPDTTVWREEMAYNEPYLGYYFRHPAYSFYPVVGVSWSQAMTYCQWRTDRVNELALISIGAMAPTDYAQLAPNNRLMEEDREAWETENPPYQLVEVEVPDEFNPGETRIELMLPYEYVRDKVVFNTEKYLYLDEYIPEYGRHPKLDTYGAERKVNSGDGVLVIGYRLPTEAEWEFAAYAPIAGEDGLTIEGKVYPWSGYHPRDLSKENAGRMQANFVRGRGDMMGVSGSLNDNYVITGPVDAFLPNDFGLYNMAGNVNEWVMDVYRETSYQETSEYNSFRGNIFTQPKRDENGKLSLDSLGCIEIMFTESDDKRDYRDGDSVSRIQTDYPLDTLYKQEGIEYKVDPSDILVPRISKNARVYKGGSWRDRVYWVSPSARRFLDQDKSSSTIGFRCAMSMLGSQQLREKGIN